MIKWIDINSVIINLEKNLNNFSLKEIKNKLNILKTVIMLIFENPKFNNVKQKEEILKKLSYTATILYEQIIKFANDNSLEYASNLVLYKIYSQISNKQIISDIVIKNKIDRLLYINSNTDILVKLELELYRIILLLIISIKNYTDFQYLQNIINIAEELLKEVQRSEIKNNFKNIERGIKISVIANIMHLTNIMQEYLFTGKIANEDISNIKNIIQIYTHNAINLINNDNNLKEICYLIKYIFIKKIETIIK